jgi:CMP-N-acetylneuraminic acid synthetase
MTPLIIVPARQLSEGRPCKNRENWAALVECVTALPESWPVAVVTDDPMVTGAVSAAVNWLPMDANHTVADVVRWVLQWSYQERDPIVVLQPSSPTRDRFCYVLAAVEHLRTRVDHTSVVSVVPWTGEPPSKACTLAPDGTLVIPRVNLEPRQLQPQHYRRDGAVYAVRAEYARQGDLYGPRPIPLLIDPRDSLTID